MLWADRTRTWSCDWEKVRHWIDCYMGEVCEDTVGVIFVCLFACLLLLYILATYAVIPGRYWLATMHTHDKFIVLPPWHHDLLSQSLTLSWQWANQYLPYPNNAECQARKRQVSILKSLVWLDWEPNSQSSTREACTLPIWPPHPVSFHQTEQLNL